VITPKSDSTLAFDGHCAMMHLSDIDAEKITILVVVDESMDLVNIMINIYDFVVF
jgi:hypothetical protein